jgi:Fur family zinc uptake transcriptional regulator
MKNTDSIIRRAEKHCESRGTRLTKKRKYVLTGLVESDKALSAYELIDVCKQKYGADIPAMSVYRILEFLESEHLVHKLNTASKYASCANIASDEAGCYSQFLICSSCSKVKEVGLKPSMMAELQATVQDASFKLVNPQLEMNCLCNDCA